MAKLVSKESVDLVKRNDINEAMIQEYIFNNPSVLGLGNLTPLRREKMQPSGGRLDILLGDDDGKRYEVEIQLGPTDPSHIVRTLEYWDSERKRYPQYDHCAVIVAEDITSRFQNVISLFNGFIPLIALKMTATPLNDEDVLLTFTKIFSRNIIADDEDETTEPTDRKYWENRSNAKMLGVVDSVYQSLETLVEGYELKYNKFYIGLTKNGIARNFISFKPKKSFIYLVVKGKYDEQIQSNLDGSGLEASYENRWNEYDIKLNSFEGFKKHKELLLELISNAKRYYNLDD